MNHKKLCIELYKTMLTIRIAEEKVIELYPSDKIQSPVHLSIGQEAVSAGVCKALNPHDHVYGTYRGHGLFIAKGGKLGKLFAELYGKQTGCAKGKGGSMHLVAPEVGLMACSAIVAGTVPVATGDALSAKLQNSKRVVVSFLGDGAIDEGVFFESVNFALVKNLPIIYVIENNGYAIHSRVTDRHQQTRLCKIATGLGLNGSRHDGDNVLMVYETMKKAAKNISEGQGPILIEYLTHRWKEHVGIGEDLGEVYRSQNEKEEIVENDPIKNLRILLKKKHGVSERHFSIWEQNIIQKVQDAVDFAEKSPFPNPEQLLEGVFSKQ